MAKVFFHIGMHKTATGWFQRQLFPNIHDIRLINSKKVDEIAGSMETLEGQTRPRENADVIIVSHEGLGGSISWGRTPGETTERLSRNLRALMKLRPDASVIVGYREQGRWLASAFAQRAGKKLGATSEAYLSRFSIEELCWCNGLRLIDSLCPSVFPFLYEELVESPEILVEDLCRFIGRPPPSDMRQLLRLRENPSQRSRLGQAISAMSWPVLRRIDVSARNRFRLGVSYFDSLFSARPVDLPGPWQLRLRQDWNELLALVGERRGRDLLRFRETGARTAELAS